MARTYPPKKCKNPACPNKSFTPRRSNQLFCDGCKDNFYNDKRREKNNTVFQREKQLRWNANTLEKLSKDPLYEKGVPVDILKHERIDLKVYTHKMKNRKTDRTVYFSHNYGLEWTGTKPAIFLIHHVK